MVRMASVCQRAKTLCRLVKPLHGYGRFSIFKDSGDVVWRANMRHRAKFGANRSNRRRDMAIFPFFNMAADRCLGFLNV